jgi:hypothetical protein
MRGRGTNSYVEIMGEGKEKDFHFSFGAQVGAKVLIYNIITKQ